MALATRALVTSFRLALSRLSTRRTASLIAGAASGLRPYRSGTATSPTEEKRAAASRSGGDAGSEGAHRTVQRKTDWAMDM